MVDFNLIWFEVNVFIVNIQNNELEKNSKKIRN